MYIKRTIENTITKMVNEFPIIVISGARQVGKSTMLQMIRDENMNYVSLDDLDARNLILPDPKYFLQQYSFSSYINTYIERNIKQLLNVGKTIEFYNFMQYIAVRTAQELNYSTIAKEIGVDSKTIKNWISILESFGIIYLLQPFSSNLSNRIIKSSKLYFMDTGLCSYLVKYPNSETLEAGGIIGSDF